jgi:hypothetical protein
MDPVVDEHPWPGSVSRPPRFPAAACEVPARRTVLPTGTCRGAVAITIDRWVEDAHPRTSEGVNAAPSIHPRSDFPSVDEGRRAVAMRPGPSSPLNASGRRFDFHPQRLSPDRRPPRAHSVSRRPGNPQAMAQYRYIIGTGIRSLPAARRWLKQGSNVRCHDGPQA